MPEPIAAPPWSVFEVVCTKNKHEPFDFSRRIALFAAEVFQSSAVA
jgi:hypothetical protein